ncbi:MAG TPA: type II toxin-antitoxin system VapC family toxin [Gemmataceae bacterium]|nr:type II toxin-antitoxin system VapC family toxin [Gemmataceae bacterium]
MTFEDIPAGSAIFVDANIFVYHYEPHPVFGPPCAQFLLRIENHELDGFTSAQVLGDVMHRVMTLEAAKLFSRPWAGIANWLKQHPTELQRLSRHRSVVDDLALIGIQILPVNGPLVSRAADVCVQFGLLTNDALVVTVMQHHSLSHLASHDADFDRVPGLTRYAPT